MGGQPFRADVPEGGPKEEAQDEAEDEAGAVVAGVAVVADEVAVGNEPVLGQVGLREPGGEVQGRLALLGNAQLFYQLHILPARSQQSTESETSPGVLLLTGCLRCIVWTSASASVNRDNGLEIGQTTTTLV